MIDTSKIRPGDTGTIKVRFRELGDDGTFWWIESDRPTKYPAPFYLSVAHSAIASHTPAPWVPEKGDVVEWSLSGGEWTVRGIDGGDAWIEGARDNCFACLRSLTLIRKGAA